MKRDSIIFFRMFGRSLFSYLASEKITLHFFFGCDAQAQISIPRFDLFFELRPIQSLRAVTTCIWRRGKHKFTCLQSKKLQLKDVGLSLSKSLKHITVTYLTCHVIKVLYIKKTENNMEGLFKPKWQNYVRWNQQ